MVRTCDASWGYPIFAVIIEGAVFGLIFGSVLGVCLALSAHRLRVGQVKWLRIALALTAVVAACLLGSAVHVQHVGNCVL